MCVTSCLDWTSLDKVVSSKYLWTGQPVDKSSISTRSANGPGHELYTLQVTRWQAWLIWRYRLMFYASSSSLRMSFDNDSLQWQFISNICSWLLSSRCHQCLCARARCLCQNCNIECQTMQKYIARVWYLSHLDIPAPGTVVLASSCCSNAK